MNDDADRVRQGVEHHFSGRSGTESVAIPAAERYAAELLADLPADLVACSDGCGNPLIYTEIRPGQTVLDLGSGGGLDLILAATKVGPTGSVIGVDMTESMLEMARANAARVGATQVELRRGLIEELPVDSNSVDWIISNCVINLSPQKDRVFSEIVRVLRPGGTVVISDTVVGGVPRWCLRVGGWFNPVVNVLTDERDYLDLVRGAGLEDVELLDKTTFAGSRLERMMVIEAARYQGGPAAIAKAERMWLSPVAKVMSGALSGKVSSIKVKGRKADS